MAKRSKVLLNRLLFWYQRAKARPTPANGGPLLCCPHKNKPAQDSAANIRPLIFQSHNLAGIPHHLPKPIQQRQPLIHLNRCKFLRFKKDRLASSSLLKSLKLVRDWLTKLTKTESKTKLRLSGPDSIDRLKRTFHDVTKIIHFTLCQKTQN